MKKPMALDREPSAQELHGKANAITEAAVARLFIHGTPEITPERQTRLRRYLQHRFPKFTFLEPDDSTIQ